MRSPSGEQFLHGEEKQRRRRPVTLAIPENATQNVHPRPRHLHRRASHPQGVSTTTFRMLLAAGGSSLVPATSASAHITLATQEAPVGGSYKALFQVGHGCDGSPTVKNPRADPGARPCREASAEAGLASRDRQGQVREDRRLLRHQVGRRGEGGRLVRRRRARRVVPCLLWEWHSGACHASLGAVLPSRQPASPIAVRKPSGRRPPPQAATSERTATRRDSDQPDRLLTIREVAEIQKTCERTVPRRTEPGLAGAATSCSGRQHQVVDVAQSRAGPATTSG